MTNTQQQLRQVRNGQIEKTEKSTKLANSKQFEEDLYQRHVGLDETKDYMISSAKIEYYTKLFAAMCPDEILAHYDDYDTREYHTTLMLGDVSGFTDLTEKYTRTGKGGPSKLTEILNSYIGAMVQEILSHNGDVLKFSGDAFIVMWKMQDGMVMQDVANEAMQTACSIQKHFGTYDSDVGVTLRVKLAIASGKTYFTSIGDPAKMSYYIITGAPVWDVKTAEGLCGDIIVAPSSWQWVNPNEYVFETLPDNIHTLILATSSMWEPTKERFAKRESKSIEDQDDEAEYNSESRHASVFASFASDRIPEPEAAPVLMNLTGDTLEEYQFKQVDYSLRPMVNRVAKLQLKNKLRSYIVRPVVRSVEMDEPLEYLTEMRQVVILFLNVITINVGKRKLIATVNTAYKLVCGIVDSMQGCTNKTSLFDKDLMFLCIFGLRGDKHELESQIGLRCAVKLRETLTLLKNIKSVTIGVTTGMTYCGVVGHILRREYTVIGMAVNRAARLMCSYPDRVICDRDTFLHSRLDARHFILQEPKLLKGITNVGPLYEFQEQTAFQNQNAVMNKFPLLGRDSDVATFRKMLHNVIYVHRLRSQKGGSISTKKNTLIIRGEPRMGKTRLLDEMVHHIPRSVPSNRITLLPTDNKSPYSLIHLIFTMPLAFTASSTPKEREDKLISLIGKFNHPNMLCSMNQVFNVNFAMTQRYSMMYDSEKQEVMQRLLSKLMASCFKSLWVIFIDDAEYSDDESLSLLPTLIKQDLLFIIMAQNLAPDLRFEEEVLEKAVVIELSGLDKWYHAGLACQILDVRAIPAELEMVIQQNSLGNPGWIESYLVSLVQAEGLVMSTLNKNQLRNLGLVAPPLEMIQRDDVVRDRMSSKRTTVEITRMDGWKMYKSSYKESYMNISNYNLHTPVVESEDDEMEYAVCTITPNFVLDDVDPEITMDVMILKMFDSLSSHDQLLLKCAAVLGETFDRQMLVSLLEGTTARVFALAVQRLFEIRILGCAIGDFKRSPGPIAFLRKVRNPNVDMEIRCVCTGIKIDASCKDLPNYASCGLIRFKMPMFRDTTYRLMTEHQKVEFHDKALKYLQKKTRRCVACGGGHFVKLLGQRYDEEEQHKEKKKQEAVNFAMDLSDYVERVNTYDDQTRSLSELDISKDKTCKSFFFRTIERCSTRSFSNVDFADCQCNLILVTMYTQALAHCRGIGRKDQTLTAILEFAEVCLSACNIPEARKLLNDGEVILSQMTGLNPDEETLILPYLSGKIKTLQGRCNLESGLITEAMDCLYEAIKSLGYHYPTRKLVARVKSLILLEHQKLMLRCLRSCSVGTAEGYAADFSDQLANCLAQMFTIFQIRGLDQHSHLAAIWGLNAALESNKDFFALCTAYANMLITAHNFRHKSIIPTLEDDAINVCCRKKDAVELQELKAVAELYMSIFFSRWLRGETASATSIGFRTIRICQLIHSVTLKLVILPMLIHLLMIECRHGEVVSMLQELEFTSNIDMDKSGRTWYYALCIDFQLETGLTVISFRKCEQYYLEEGETMVNLRDPEAEKRYFTCMWLWCIRNNDWEAATVWKNKSSISMDNVEAKSIAGILTAMKKLEGLLIYYVHKLDNRNAKAISITLTEIQVLFKRLGQIRKISNVGLARFLMLKAYYRMIRGQTRSGMKMLQESKKVAMKQDKKLMYDWAEHCEKVWTGSISSIQRDFWKEHCTLDTVLDWHEIDMKACKVVPFSLPLPKYPH